MAPDRHSPLVLRLAEEFGIDLSTIQGSGPGGRVTRHDVQAAAFGAEAAAALGGEQHVEPPAGPPEHRAHAASPTPPDPPVRAVPPVPPTHPSGLNADVTADFPNLRIAAPEPDPADSVEPDEPSEPVGEPSAATWPVPPQPAAWPVAGAPSAAEPVSAVPLEVEPMSTGAAVEPVMSAIEPVDPGTTRQQLSERQRKAMAGLNRAWTVPQFSATVDANVDQLLRAHDRLVGRGAGADLPQEALLIRLAQPVLDEFPQMNAMLDGGEVLLFKRRDVAFSCPTASGLQVPVVRHANQLSLTELGETVRDLIERAGRRELTGGEVGGQTFTVINAGALGVRSLTPVLPLATAAVVAYGSPQPVVQMLDDGPREMQVMTITGTFDHRVIDPVEAAGFLSALASYLEDPIMAFAS